MLTLVAGPNRPAPPKAASASAPRKPLITWGDAPEEPIKPAPKTAELQPKRTAVKDQVKRGGPARDAREREDAYTEMRAAAQERGNYLDNLGDSLNSVSISAGNYLSSARNTAVSDLSLGGVRGECYGRSEGRDRTQVYTFAGPRVSGGRGQRTLRSG